MIINNGEVYQDAMDYLQQNKDKKICYMCGKFLQEGELYMCIFCQEKVETAR